jgi:methyltransferase-like protein/trans-aconitate methyltransferase
MRTDTSADRNGAAHAEPPPGGDYNFLPYPSMPFAYTQPAHLAAITTLFGLEAPPAHCARVLELGCASGGNIIPLAARFPNARFLGVDLAQRHIADGEQRIAALGLANVELRQGDLTQVTFPGEQFDYVICHGVFSWVPRAAQDSIFRICGEALATNGVAAISYNVLPGWHLRRIVRDICLHHVGKDGPPWQRVVGARRLLEQIAKSASETGPYGQLLRNEAMRTARRPASYILGEFLATDNTPCYFHEFVERAGQYGLSYLCEGDLNSSIPEILNPDIRHRNRALAGSDPLALEQYIDFFTGRTFRRSVLINAQQVARVQRNRSLERLRPLHFASRLRFDDSQSNDKVSVYKDDRGRVIKARSSSVRHALARLAECYPATLTFTQLTEHRSQDEVGSDAEARVCNALFTMVVAGQATVSVLPLQVGCAASERPKVWSLARAEAAAGQPWVTSLQHAPIALQPIAAALLAHLDGSNDRQKLKVLLVEALQRGSVRVPELQIEQANSENAQLETVAGQYVERTLIYLARHALLEP